jgi:hypothetical protein
MTNNEVGEIRRSSVVTIFGPGAIVDMRAGEAAVSGVHAGLEEWDSNAPLEGPMATQKIFERRLQRKLGKSYFRLAPVFEEFDSKRGGQRPRGLVLRRFPHYLQCPQCSLLQPATKWASRPGDAGLYCGSCTAQAPGGKHVFVIPTRFVTACADGHLDDFPWDFWVAHKPTCSRRKGLTLTSRAAGHQGLILACGECESSRSMKDAFLKTALAGLTCQGRRPWLAGAPEHCDCNGVAGTYRVLQRGGSNVYYPVIESALDIPPWTDRINAIIAERWDDLAALPSAERVAWMSMTRSFSDQVERAGLTIDQVASAFEVLLARTTSAVPEDIRADEFEVFNSLQSHIDNEFETHPFVPGSKLSSHIGLVSRVARLREIRVLRGFTRINPPFDSSQPDVASLSEGVLPWLPATELRGEGIFLSLNSEVLATWESRASVTERCAPLQEAWRREWEVRHPGAGAPFELSPRRVLVHSLSHALVRQLTLNCGYNSASLRERLYVNDDSPSAGLLIYTGAPDADGTLGGLQAQARGELIGETVLSALRGIAWCSSDPLCILGELSGQGSHSAASCHACLMLPETSCESHNMFLDRGLLFGTPENPELGYFSPDFLKSGLEPGTSAE